MKQGVEGKWAIMAGFAQQLLTDALRQAEGYQTQAARHLSLSYHQFRYYLKKYTT